MTLDEKLIQITPSKRQFAFQQLEFYAFVHFTVNTFTDKEWGDGTESPSIFNPIDFDAENWVNAIKAAGMKGLILTCKHHDGFCLWHSKQTKHSVKFSPFKRDIVKEVSATCKKQGIKFGVYLSPWDRNCELYGQGKAYDDYFVNQLTELLSWYGDIFSVWFDGACGEGPNGKKQYYDWERYYSVIRKLQPNACINVCGPDIRWCGNEAGHTRVSEWSVVPARTRDTEKIQEASQHKDDEEFRQREIHAQDADLGSRKVLENETDFVWYPAEVNTSIRPGWFYHSYEDDKVRSLEDLIHVYNTSVGGNATFLLNIPPTPNGCFHQNDVQRLQELGDYIKNTFLNNLSESAKIWETNSPSVSIKSLQTDSYETFWQGANSCAELHLSFDRAVTFSTIVLKENILKSQRIERFEVYAKTEAKNESDYEKLYEGTVVGYKKIIPLHKTQSSEIVIKITDSRVCPTLSFVGVY